MAFSSDTDCGSSVRRTPAFSCKARLNTMARVARTPTKPRARALSAATPCWTARRSPSRQLGRLERRRWASSFAIPSIPAHQCSPCRSDCLEHRCLRLRAPPTCFAHHRRRRVVERPLTPQPAPPGPSNILTSSLPALVRPTPRISCEARLNEEKPTLDTYLQDLRASSAASAC